ncbi:hypothetical protein HanHA89_Chr01g0020511 [Helianthus annuus]|nr:hypothetical protein HanHA89_Chr01g0020511 [Helianthus annuus]
MWTKCLQSARRRGFVFFLQKQLHTQHTHNRSALSLYKLSLSLQPPPPPSPPPSHHHRHHTTAITDLSLSLRSLSLRSLSLRSLSFTDLSLSLYGPVFDDGGGGGGG